MDQTEVLDILARLTASKFAAPHVNASSVLVYNPDLIKEDAAIVDLSQEPDLKIAEALKPSSLPPEALAWLNPRKRLSYFYSPE